MVYINNFQGAILTFIATCKFFIEPNGMGRNILQLEPVFIYNIQLLINKLVQLFGGLKMVSFIFFMPCAEDNVSMRTERCATTKIQYYHNNTNPKYLCTMIAYLQVWHTMHVCVKQQIGLVLFVYQYQISVQLTVKMINKWWCLLCGNQAWKEG